jgi:predicted dehydrogenase
MRQKTSRRRFLQGSAAAGIGFWVAGGVQAQESKSPNEKIRFACIGVSGKGQSDSADAARSGDIVAICDADQRILTAAGNAYPNAKKFTDFRKLFDEAAKDFDAVTVSTPDHIHAVAAVMAMKHGKHCFCQKPLTRSIFEARRMGEVAREMKVATQMGNQGTAGDGLRKAAALIRAGLLGKVTEVHVWTNRPIWPQGGPRPETAPVPEGLDWQSWLGPAPERPYTPGYHPFKWRGYWDFGSGALGDMACHTVNMPYMGLGLRDPLSVQAESSGHNKDTYPSWSIINFEFGPSGDRPGLKFVWYDGGKKAPMDLVGEVIPVDKKSGEKKQPGSGCVVIGEKGKLFSPDDYGSQFYVTESLKEAQAELEKTITYPKSPGHFQEYVRAIKGGEAAMSNFPDYSGPLTETILLGNLAVWTAHEGKGPKVEWDAKNLCSPNTPGLESIIKPPYRPGYSI